jgi:hypothetical protein
MKWIILPLAVLFTFGLHDNPVTSKTFQSKKEIVCFVYHRFGDSRYPRTNVSISDFETHLKYLLENDFQLLRFQKLFPTCSLQNLQKKRR